MLNAVLCSLSPSEIHLLLLQVTLDLHHGQHVSILPDLFAVSLHELSHTLVMMLALNLRCFRYMLVYCWSELVVVGERSQAFSIVIDVCAVQTVLS